MMMFYSKSLMKLALKQSPSVLNVWTGNRIFRLFATQDVFLGNLPTNVDESTLSNLVSQKIGQSFTSIRLATDRVSGVSRGFAYLTFPEKEAAETALSNLAGLAIEGKPVKLDLAQPRKKPSDAPSSAGAGPTPTNSKQSVFIGNLSYETNESEVQELLDQIFGAGFAKNIRLSIDRNTGRTKGFCHVELGTTEDVSKAIEGLTGKELKGRLLKVDVATERDRNTPNQSFSAAPAASGAPRTGFTNTRQHSVFIGNLAWSVDENMIKDMVNEMVGPDLFLNVRLATDRETGRSRGFGHIDFKSQQDAERAVQILNDLEVEGRNIRADYAQPKSADRFNGSRSPVGARY